MDNNDELKRLLEVYNEIVLPTVYDDAESYYETLGRIRYVLNELAKQGVKDYTADFQKILEDVAAQRPVLEGQISTETNEETEAVGKVTAALNDEIKARNDADTALESEVESTVNNLSNIGINRGLILVSNDESLLLTTDELKRFKYVYTVKAELSAAANAVAISELNIEDPKNITDVVFVGMPDSTATATSSTANLVTYIKQAYPNAITYLMPYSITPLSDDSKTKRNAMFDACQQGAYFLGCTYMSCTAYKESAAQEITTGRSNYAVKVIYRSTKTGTAETDSSAYLGVELTAKPFGISARLVAVDENNVEKSGVTFSGTGEYDYVKSYDFGLTEELPFFEPTGDCGAVRLRTDKLSVEIDYMTFAPTATGFIIV